VLRCAVLRGGAVLYVCHARDVCLYLTHGTCLSVCLSVCGCLPLSCQVRRKVGIEGDQCSDICIHCWGHQCALCQEQREIVDAIDNGRVLQVDRRGRVVGADGSAGGAPVMPVATVTMAIPPGGAAAAMPTATATFANSTMPTATATVLSTNTNTANPVALPTAAATWQGAPAASSSSASSTGAAAPLAGLLSETELTNMANGVGGGGSDTPPPPGALGERLL
jgi:hypothetical protein